MTLRELLLTHKHRSFILEDPPGTRRLADATTIATRFSIALDALAELRDGHITFIRADGSPTLTSVARLLEPPQEAPA